MTIKEKLFEKKSIIKEIAAKHGAYDIRIFGSVSRGDDKQGSDIDLLVIVKDSNQPTYRLSHEVHLSLSIFAGYQGTI